MLLQRQTAPHRRTERDIATYGRLMLSHIWVRGPNRGVGTLNIDRDILRSWQPFCPPIVYLSINPSLLKKRNTLEPRSVLMREAR
jgi:hypothetical protein